MTHNSAPLLSSVVLKRLIDLAAEGSDQAQLLHGIERIFRATATRWPDSVDATRRFQELWLGQYLEHEPELVWLALAAPSPTTSADILGYLVGCRLDPATDARFASLSYFQNFAAHTQRFPAHLHINLDPRARGHGIGARLVDALCRQLTGEGVVGIHVVTGRGMRNVGFYERLGFVEQAYAARGSGEVVMLGRALAGQ